MISLWKVASGQRELLQRECQIPERRAASKLMQNEPTAPFLWQGRWTGSPQGDTFLSLKLSWFWAAVNVSLPLGTVFMPLQQVKLPNPCPLCTLCGYREGVVEREGWRERSTRNCDVWCGPGMGPERRHAHGYTPCTCFLKVLIILSTNLSLSSGTSSEPAASHQMNPNSILP